MARTSSSSSPGDPFERASQAGRELLRRSRTDRLDALVVLGSGLSPAAPLLGAAGAPVDLTTLPWFPRFTALGHRAEAWPIELGGHRVLVTAGRAHLYEGLTANEVVHAVRTAIAAGCRTIVLTCSAGAVRPEVAVGSVRVVSDHVNLTGMSPLTGVHAAHPLGTPFVDLVDAWSPRLRHLAAEVDPTVGEGVYAQVPGPQFETPAEIRMLAAAGIDLVGTSMVLEAVAARQQGAQVLGLVAVTNAAAGASTEPFALDRMIEAAAGAVPVVATIVGGVVEQLDAGPNADYTR